MYGKLIAGWVVLTWALAVTAQSVPPQNRVIPGPSVVDERAKVNKIDVDQVEEFKESQHGQDAIKVLLRSIVLEGVTVWDARQLLVQAGYLPDVFYSFDELEAIAAKITKHYRDHGFMVARAILPAQDLSAGVARISVFEGRFSKSNPFQVEDSGGRASGAWAIDRVLRSALCGEGVCGHSVIHVADVERALALINDVVGVKVVQANLESGQEVGSTRLRLRPSWRAPYQLEVGADNLGARATGQAKIQTRLGVHDVVTVGDQLGIAYLGTEKSNLKFFGLDYSLPVGYAGWRGGISLGRTYFVLPTFANASGDAVVTTLYTSYPLMRAARAVTDFTLAYDHVQLSQDIGEQSHRMLQTLRVGWSGSYQDALSSVGRSNTEWAVNTTIMTLKLPDGQVDVNNTQGGRSKLAWRHNRVQQLGEQGWFAGFNAYGQSASNNLDPYAKLGLGGGSAVRAYAQGEASGDHATIVQLSFGKSWGRVLGEQAYNFSLAAFYDRGWSRLQSRPQTTDANVMNRRGHGLEFQLSRKNAVSMRVFWARAGDGESTIDGKQKRVGITLGLAY